MPVESGYKTTDSRFSPRVRVMVLKPYGRDRRLYLRKPGDYAAMPILNYYFSISFNLDSACFISPTKVSISLFVRLTVEFDL